MKSSNKLLIGTILLLCLNSTYHQMVSKGLSWAYRSDGFSYALLPPYWGQLPYSTCDGYSQSPIDIRSDDTFYSKNLKTLEIQVQGDEYEQTWIMQNKLYTLFLTPLNSYLSIVSPIDYKTYDFNYAFFSWAGSEHHVNGKEFAGEFIMKFTNYNSQLFLSFLIEYGSDKYSSNFQAVTNHTNEVIHYYTQTILYNFNLFTDIPKTIENYFYYSGSLVTPPCDEGVHWFVVDKPVLKFSKEQITDLQKIEGPTYYPVLENDRPIQPLNGRKVYRSFKKLGLSRGRVASNFVDLRPYRLDEYSNKYEYSTKYETKPENQYYAKL